MLRRPSQFRSRRARLPYSFLQIRAASSKKTSLLPIIHLAANLVFSSGPYIKSEKIHYVRSKTADGSFTAEEPVTPFFISSPDHNPMERPVGFLRTEVLTALREAHLEGTSSEISPWDLHRSSLGRIWAVSFASWVNKGGSSLRATHIGQLVNSWRANNAFPSILRGWSNEYYPVYFPYHTPKRGERPTVFDPVAFSIERAALPLFGFQNHGCLLTAYFKSPKTGETMIWVPRRSKSKRTWPGALDVTVGGGMGIGDTALSTIVRESTEEASINPAYVRSAVRPVGTLSFPNRSPAGWILPGLYHLFDLPLREDGTPRPHVNENDGEVEAFELMTTTEVLCNILAQKFKPSSALALVDFLIRHGHCTEETDPLFAEVRTTLENLRSPPNFSS